jgi:hypothetical protein
LAIFLIGIIFIFTIGIDNSYFFFGGTRISFTDSRLANEFIKQFGGYSTPTLENGWYCVYSSAINSYSNYQQ